VVTTSVSTCGSGSPDDSSQSSSSVEHGSCPEPSSVSTSTFSVARPLAVVAVVDFVDPVCLRPANEVTLTVGMRNASAYAISCPEQFKSSLTSSKGQSAGAYATIRSSADDPAIETAMVVVDGRIRL
jgi:hypothetical protein